MAIVGDVLNDIKCTNFQDDNRLLKQNRFIMHIDAYYLKYNFKKGKFHKMPFS